MAEQTEHARQPERLSLSATQIIASVLAAISASVAASYFGIAGTMIGAALGSVISVVGGAVYAHSISKTRQRLRRTALDTAVEQRFDVKRRPAWRPKQIALAAAALFVIAIGSVTGLELLSGKPISATVGGKAESGTSLFGADHRQAVGGQTSGGSTSTTPSSTAPTKTVTVTVTPSAKPTASTPTTPSSSPTTPAGTPTQSAATQTPTPTPTPSGGAS
jgi:phage gpG-like protein